MADIVGLNITSPQSQIHDSPLVESWWFAAHNPLVFKLQMWNYNVVSITKTTLPTCTLVSTTGLFHSGMVGKYIYVFTPKHVGIYVVSSYTDINTITVEITDWISDESGLTTAFIYDVNYLATNVIDIKLQRYYTTGVLDPLYIINESSNFLSNKGYAEIDISEFSKLYLTQFNLADYTLRIDDSQFTKFKLLIDGINQSFTFYPIVVNACKQIGDQYGSNMRKYIMVDQTHFQTHKGKFLTDFDEPVYFAGYPFCLGLINHDSNDKNGEQWEEEFTTNNVGYHTTKTGISFEADHLYWIILRGLALTDSDCKKIEMYIAGITTGADITEQKTINVIQPCSVSGEYFYIRWVNYLGGLNHWLFQGVNVQDVDQENLEIVRTYQGDISASKGTDVHRGKTIYNTMEVRQEFLTKNQWQCMCRMPATVEYYNAILGQWFYAQLMPDSHPADMKNGAHYFDAKFIFSSIDLQSW